MNMLRRILAGLALAGVAMTTIQAQAAQADATAFYVTQWEYNNTPYGSSKAVTEDFYLGGQNTSTGTVLERWYAADDTYLYKVYPGPTDFQSVRVYYVKHGDAPFITTGAWWCDSRNATSGGGAGCVSGPVAKR